MNFTISVSETVREEIEKKAKRMGLNTSAYIRMVCLTYPDEEKVDKIIEQMQKKRMDGITNYADYADYADRGLILKPLEDINKLKVGSRILVHVNVTHFPEDPIYEIVAYEGTVQSTDPKYIYLNWERVGKRNKIVKIKKSNIVNNEIYELTPA